MQNKYSANDVNKENVLYSFNIDWPYEKVSVQAKVVSVQTQNIFKWAVVRILEDFHENIPSLDEAAEQLGIKNAVFLKEVLEGFIAEGTIEKIDSEKDIDFSNCRIVNYSNLQTQHCEPQLHGFTLFFDAVIGEYAPLTINDTERKPENPVISPDKLPDLRIQISLEKARNYARIQNEPFLTAQSNIIDVRINPGMSSIVWRPVKADIVIDRAGIIRCLLDSASQSRQDWIDGLDFGHRIFKKIFNSNIDRRFYPAIKSAISFDKWNSSHDSLINPEELTEKATELILSSQANIVIDAYWINFPSIQQALFKALNNNVALTICARGCQLTDIPEQLTGSADIVELEDYPRILLMSDESDIISIDHVEVNTPQNKKLKVIASSFLKPAYALELRHELSNRNIKVKT